MLTPCVEAIAHVSHSSGNAQVSNALSGYEHNAVTPIGAKISLPIVVSDRILALRYNPILLLLTHG